MCVYVYLSVYIYIYIDSTYGTHGCAWAPRGGTASRALFVPTVRLRPRALVTPRPSVVPSLLLLERFPCTTTTKHEKMPVSNGNQLVRLMAVLNGLTVFRFGTGGSDFGQSDA